MARLPLVLLALSAAFIPAAAYDLTGRIVWNDVCPNYESLGQAKVILDDGALYGGVTADGSFSIPDVNEGVYVLSVVSHSHVFDQLRLTIPPPADNTTDFPLPPLVHPLPPGVPLFPPTPPLLPYPPALSAAASLGNAYFVPHEGFNLLGMFQNPMMLMMVFAGVMMLAMPYIMKNLDPETLSEINNRQSRVANIQSQMLSGDVKGLSSLLNAPEEGANVSSGIASASTAAKPAQTAVAQRKGKKGKR